ncbi:MAG: CBS domain-containing protein [Idiomarina sp.]|nr:CBS domain-containing protein [Idiomarina sp.]
MALDLKDMADFLKQTPPFDMLDEQRFDYALDHAEAIYVNEHNTQEVLRSGHPLLYVVRSGTFDLNDKNGKHIERLETGDVFGYPALLTGRAITNKIDVLADGILFSWDEATFNYLRRYSDAFERYFMQAQSERLLTEQRSENQAPDWTELDIGSVINRDLISIDSASTIQNAAICMAEHKVSSLLVVDDGQLRGILTDRDIRNRVVAKGMSYEVAVSAVMTQMPEAVYARQSLFDALTVMNQANIHHLPVLDDDDTPVGMITTTDLMKQQRSEPVFLMNALFKAPDRDALVAEAQSIPQYLRTFASRVKDISMVGRLLASLTDGMTRKLIRLYEQSHGSAPVAYAWMAFGSQAREDQTLSSDQDNGLLLADNIKDGQRAYFQDMAEFVCTGLGDCGIRLCPGDVMAMNPKWNKTSLEWREQFKKWIQSPTPDAIMHSMIFFDSRMIAGNTQLYKKHREAVAKLAQRDIFLGNIGRHIGELNVPIGLFNRLRTKSEKGGDYIDIKTQGVAIINDIVRLYALEQGLTMPATPARLQALQGSRLLTKSDNQNLLEAWQFLTQLRLSHQLRLQGDSTEPVNSVDPETLSTLQRRQMKAAFRIIKDAQQGVGFKLGRGM